ncbi:MAG: nickel-dependent hydrogenase large subunit [Zoogloea sp.]|nr:nickel-dependent hydrogenase large subunit [Zoogloea sp.]
MTAPTSRIVVGPFNRVEGDLEVSLDVADGRVASARVTAPMYRGFEQILAGKVPLDALMLVPRICGICSVSQSAAAAAALRNLIGLKVPENGELAGNLVLASENLADHLTHFYLFFMPDFARDAYASRPWFPAARARFKAVEGRATAEVLPARASFLHLLGMLAGKWPHTLSLQPGGSARAVSAAEKIRAYGMLREFRGFLERRLFGDSLEAIAALDSAEALAAWCDTRPADASDFRFFLAIADDLGLEGLGRASDLFLSHGNYPLGGKSHFAEGVWDAPAAMLLPLAEDDVTEDPRHAWLAGHGPAHPWAGATLPDADKPDAYTWCKAPRWRNRVAECGALARQVVDGHPLARSLVAQAGGNVRSRVVARLLELALVVPAMEDWVRRLAPGEPFCAHGILPDEGRAVGRVEAARGALGHWLVVRHGRIASYQIIAPTTWNFSPRDTEGTPGALEQALVGTPVGTDDAPPLAVQHVVRSYDPCMVCTVT